MAAFEVITEVMTGLVLFARLAAASSKTFVTHVTIFSWFSLLLIMGTAFCLFTSVFWGYPLDLKQFITPGHSTTGESAHAPPSGPARSPLSISIGGIVVDQNTNQGVGQARIVVDGRIEGAVTEDNGNFRIDFRSDTPARVRLHATKVGFHPLDTSVEIPGENLVLQMQRQ